MNFISDSNVEFKKNIDVSVIIPVHNGEIWIKECFTSILQQTAIGQLSLEVSVFDDASNDETWNTLQHWSHKLAEAGIHFVVSKSMASVPKGVGHAKNKAVQQSTGRFLCFQDMDDVMLPNRILYQYQATEENPDAIVGCEFCRLPEDSTKRFTTWANTLGKEELYLQIYTSHGPTLIMPTWFCSREVFDRVGGFSEDGKGTPEDLIFFYKHLDRGGKLYKVSECLLVYRYHLYATTFTIHEDTIWSVRLEHLQKHILSKWNKFTIWNAGKQGRKFYRSLQSQHRNKVLAFCDVDVKKVGKTYTPPNDPHRIIPIIHFTDAKPPLIICIKLDLTGGSFEKNLKSLSLQEGSDYVLFS